ncbi:hypothetical protein HYPSUDRAFT_375642 [Hypholoma sublateritium FD-334 SS-4]|uniref:2'-phosphotransferase n=1 Tax=Hypholoma sublateritium (strain FD-334 SS-4) TaxID=945553 RepID=A0A0D2PAY4_HYPSF|nr:hypothetical protein HYPSUDRAFT_375642 [Hypholoma sublateritium FD-334 SS-4]
MQVARRVHCCNALRRLTTSLVFGRSWPACKDSTKQYSVKASKTEAVHEHDLRPRTAVAIPKVQPSRPGLPRSDTAPTARAPRYIPLVLDGIGERIFEFRDDRHLKFDHAHVVRPQAETISRDHAAGLSRILESGHGPGHDPVALFGILAGWILRHEARNLGYGIAPDGFVRLSDLMRYPAFRRFSVEDIAKLVEFDPKARFELSSLPDYIEGRVRDVWWIRARDTHSIPGVSPNSKRILNLAKYPVVEYRTRPENWPYILQCGIPESSHHLIQVHEVVGKDLFPGFIPKTQSGDAGQAQHPTRGVQKCDHRGRPQS